MDVAILTPIAVEYNAVRAHLDEVREETRGGLPYTCGRCRGRNGPLGVVLAQTGSGNQRLALATERAINEWRPTLILLVGVAGGVKDAAIGDVVVATKAYGYESGKEQDDGFVARPDVVPTLPHLLVQAQAAARAFSAEQAAHGSPRIFFGPIAGGEKVVATNQADLYHRLKNHYNDTLALEMEAIGFAQAALFHPQVAAFNIRGISDLLAGKSHADAGGSQERAAAAAADFAFFLLSYLDVKELKLPSVDIKAIVQKTADMLLPVLKQEAAGNAAATPAQRDLWQAVQPVFEEEWQELRSVAGGPDDQEILDALRVSLRTRLRKDEAYSRQLSALLERAEAAADTQITVSNSKNVIAGSTITVGGNMHVGDVINITQHVAQPPQQPASAEVRDIRNLIAKSRLREALEHVLSLTGPSPELSAQAVGLAQRWNRLRTDERRGLISYSEAGMENNRIVAGLLDLLRDAETA